MLHVQVNLLFIVAVYYAFVHVNEAFAIFEKAFVPFAYRVSEREAKEHSPKICLYFKPPQEAFFLSKRKGKSNITLCLIISL